MRRLCFTENRAVDTYFNIPGGRLKLREITGGEVSSQLIFHARPDEAGAKPYNYHMVDMEGAAA
ncbi:MAG: hypothetical protein SWK76_10595 [Actinomycetota bacterium]|nr:hypothetical protein [Actinomycetota bacterium]